MKRFWISILLAAVFTVSAAGCGKKEEEKKPSESEESGAAETDEEESEKPVQEDVGTEQNKTTFLQVYTKDIEENRSDEEKYRWNVVQTGYSEVTLGTEDGDEYPALAEALNSMNKSSEAYYTGASDRLYDLYIQNERDNKDFSKYTDVLKRSVLRADNHILSLLENYDNYEGGAHGYGAVTGRAFDVQSGKELTLADVTTDEDAFKNEIRDRLKDQYPDTPFFDDLNVYFDDVELDGDKAPNWAIDYEGITVYFEPYELAPYSEGILTVRFSFDEDADLFVSKYMEVPDNYIIPLAEENPAYADVDGDGVKEKILRHCVMAESDTDGYQWTLDIGDRTVSDPMYYYSNDSYLIRADGKYYVYMFDTIENDYSILYVVDLAAAEVVGDEWGCSNLGLTVTCENNDDYTISKVTKEAFLNPESFVLGSRMNVLSTYTGTKIYYVGENGTPYSSDEQYAADGITFAIKPVKDIPCEQVDQDGNILNSDAVLPEGTMLRIIRTNGVDTVDVQAADFNITEEGDADFPFYLINEPVDLNKGEFYRIRYEERDYQEYIGDDVVYDLFEGMRYAG